MPTPLTYTHGPLIGGITLAGLAVLLFGGLYVWTHVGTVAEGDGMIVLGVAGLGIVGLLYAGSWTSVVIDPALRQVESSIGFLRWSAPTRVAFEDIRAVAVVRETETTRETSLPAQTGGRTSVRETRHHRYRLRLLGTGVDIGIAMGNTATPQDLEPMAQSIAAAGGWPAMRRGYDLEHGADGMVIVGRRSDAEVVLTPPR